MNESSVSVGVIVEKRKSASQWIDHTWSAVGAMPGFPDAAPLTLIEQSGDVERYFLGAADLFFHAGETANYLENLRSGTPKLWVIMRADDVEHTVSLVAVTVDPAEGEGYAQAPSNLVDAVPMLPIIAALLEGFVRKHHVEREFFKRKRERVDLEQMGHRRRERGNQD